MNKWFFSLLMLLGSTSAFADKPAVNLNLFARQYFETMVASQAPSASEEALENYLALLVDDVGHTHLPYEVDGSRNPDGKEMMRKGMTFYLGAHTDYKAELLDVFEFNDSAVAIRYKHSAKGIHPQNNQAISYTQVMMEVLEMEQGKVAVIRKYHE